MDDYFFDEDDESNENIEVKDDIFNYKGYFVENEEEEEKKFYEFGAHFPYMFLYQRLEIIAQEREEMQKELENKLKEKDMEKEKESRDDQGTNEESKTTGNLKDLLSNFQQKGKSRNRVDVGIGLTYIPQMNKKINNHLNAIENIEINLIKSSSGQEQSEKKENKNEKINNSNNKSNALIAKNKGETKKNNDKKVKCKNKKKNTKISHQQIKIRKRNENKALNINNSINTNNTVSINIFNKNKFGDKINPKNLTHDIPYISKIKNNLVGKLKSIKYSKERLRKQILNAGNLEQRLNKKVKMNNILSKIRNRNNKWSYSKYFGYQNTKNTSSSKNVLSKEKNKKNLMINKIGISSINQGKKGNNNIINFNKNKTNKNSNICSYNNILNNNIKSIKENNFIKNIKNNNILFSSNTNNKKYININNKKIPNKKNCKSNLYDKQGTKPISGHRRNNLDFIENICIKTNKNNISRNNNIPSFINPSQNNTNKNFYSVNNGFNTHIKSNKLKNNQININFSNNFGNLTQQLRPQNSNRWKEKNGIYNQISISNASLRKSNGVQKRSTELNFNMSKKGITKKKINIIDLQEKLKNYFSKNKDMKSAVNLKEKNKNINKSKNISLYKNNFFINKTNKSIGKNTESKNKNDNNNSKDKFKTNNTLLQTKKKHHININININNQHNIIFNKLNNGINNSINLCSVRSSDCKGINNKSLKI